MPDSPDTELTPETQHYGAGGREKFTAFLSDEGSERVVRQCISELALPFSTVHRGGIARAISHLSIERSPTVLMIDVTGVELPVSEVHHLAEVCEPGVSVIVVGDRNDVGLYRDLTQVGVSDYIVKPLNRALVLAAMQPLLGAGAAPVATSNQKLGRLIAAVGARGGVGATTIITNLAVHFAQNEARRVALVDLDLHSGDAALMLDVKVGGGLREVLENPQRVDELFLERAMMRSGEKLFLLAAEEKLEQPLRLDASALDPLFGLLRKQFHYVLVDVPRGNPALVRQTMDLAGTRIVVADQTTRSVRDTLRLHQLLGEAQPGQRDMLVVNRIGEQGKGGIELKDFTATVGRNVDVAVPFHPKSAISAANAGKSMVASGGPLSASISEIADEMLDRKAGVARKPWWRFGR